MSAKINIEATYTNSGEYTAWVSSGVHVQPWKRLLKLTGGNPSLIRPKQIFGSDTIYFEKPLKGIVVSKTTE